MTARTRLPRSLLFLVQAWLISAQAPVLPMNQVSSFSPANLPDPPSFALPTAPVAFVSVALCSSNTSNAPRFFLTNDSTIAQPGPADLGQPNVFEISLQDGMGNWIGPMNVPGVIAVSDVSDQSSFEIAVSNTGLIHEILWQLPLLGDTTSNQAFVFSPPFSPPEVSVPTYPNYTLPPAELAFPPAPSPSPDFSIFAAPSSATALANLPKTGCAINDVQINGSQNLPSSASQGLWLRDGEGWRWQWMFNFLSPLTNYTVYAVQNETKVSGPIYFTTKSAAFSCPIVHSIPFCPGVSYAMPLPMPVDPTLGLTAANLSDNVTTPLVSGIANFTTMLTTLACGRDDYSPLVTCADCQVAYRSWLCLVSLPRCAEFPAVAASMSASTSASSSESTSSAFPTGDGTQQPLPALQPVNASETPRNDAVPDAPGNYTALLPCLETCNAVDRACPPFLGFRCPTLQYNAAESYGVGYVDSGWESEVGGGSTGVAADSWGNVWCNS